MDENEIIDNIKYDILKEIKDALNYLNLHRTSIDVHDVQRSVVIKNLVDSYDVLNNIYQEEI
jgi:hypothetical protein